MRLMEQCCFGLKCLLALLTLQRLQHVRLWLQDEERSTQIGVFLFPFLLPTIPPFCFPLSFSFSLALCVC